MKINPIYFLLFSMMALLSCNKEVVNDGDKLIGTWKLTNIHCVDCKLKNNATDTTVIGTYAVEILESNATFTFSKSGNYNLYVQEGGYSVKLTSYFSSFTEIQEFEYDFANYGNWYIQDNKLSLIGDDLLLTFAAISKLDENNFEYILPAKSELPFLGTHTGSLYFTFKKSV